MSQNVDKKKAILQKIKDNMKQNIARRKAESQGQKVTPKKDIRPEEK